MGTHYQGSTAEKTALDTYIKLSRAAESVGAAINQHLADYQLTVSQFGVLEALYHLGPLQVGQLGEKILKSSGNMTLVLDNLSKRGLIVRQRREDDRRCIDILLTADGSSLVAQILPIHVSQVVASFSMLTAAEKQQLSHLLKIVGHGQAQLAAQLTE